MSGVNSYYIRVIGFVLSAVQFGSAQVTVSLVEQMKKAAATQMQYDYLYFTGSSLVHTGYSLSLAYGGQERIFEISGTNAHGDRVSVPFGEIESIEIRGKEGDQIQLKVTRFPMISTIELLGLKSWSQLKNRKIASEISVPLKNSNGRLKWKGQPEQHGDIVELGLVENTKVAVAIELTLPLETTWWAVPAIKADPLCTPCQSIPALYGDAAIRSPEK
jgi:hypothetical protein